MTEFVDGQVERLRLQLQALEETKAQVLAEFVRELTMAAIREALGDVAEPVGPAAWSAPDFGDGNGDAVRPGGRSGPRKGFTSNGSIRRLNFKAAGEIRRLAQQGVTVEALMTQFGTSEDAVRNVLNGLTWAKRRTRHRREGRLIDRFSPQQRSQIAEEYLRAEINVLDLRAKYRIGGSALQSILEEYGVRPGQRGQEQAR